MTKGQKVSMIGGVVAFVGGVTFGLGQYMSQYDFWIATMVCMIGVAVLVIGGIVGFLGRDIDRQEV